MNESLPTIQCIKAPLGLVSFLFLCFVYTDIIIIVLAL